ncbi:MAG: tripartite tricarboxylate transporter substrate binding protein [Betaproteobacteria bacterium]|nr:tripartite tricarboxylate transporter substrate binding protein [Betaproteobacteria bacterium]
MNRIGLSLFALALSISAVATHAQTYPQRVVRFVVPGPPGGATDILARTVGQKLTEAWGQPVIVDNRTGASGIIGTEYAARAAPDGYTLLMGHSGTHAINVSLRKTLPYHPVKDFAPITLVATAPNILLVHPSLPAKSVKELIALAKGRPRDLTYASAGVGFSQHLAGELFATMAGIKMLHVPYKGSAPALTDVIAGNVLLMFPNIPASLPHIQSGRLRALGVTALERSSVVPQVPTIAESGLPGYEAIAWFGVFAPAGLASDLVARLNADIVRILTQPEVRERITRLGADPVGNTPEQFGQYVQKEITKWAKVIKDSGAKLN